MRELPRRLHQRRINDLRADVKNLDVDERVVIGEDQQDEDAEDVVHLAADVVHLGEHHPQIKQSLGNGTLCLFLVSAFQRLPQAEAQLVVQRPDQRADDETQRAKLRSDATDAGQAEDSRG